MLFLIKYTFLQSFRHCILIFILYNTLLYIFFDYHCLVYTLMYIVNILSLYSQISFLFSFMSLYYCVAKSSSHLLSILITDRFKLLSIFFCTFLLLSSSHFSLFSYINIYSFFSLCTEILLLYKFFCYH